MNIVRLHWFTAIKYTVYVLLMVNVYLFLSEEMAALEHTFAGGVAFADIIQAFSATIDTAAWVILLLLFELETSTIPDESISGKAKLALHGIRAICYLFILYAFYGYLAELLTLYNLVPLATADACSLLATDWSLLVDLDEYQPLTKDNCGSTVGELWQVGQFTIVGDAGTLRAATLLAWTDLINSGTWIGVVLVLELDVRMQWRGGDNTLAKRLNTLVKAVLYSILLLAAVYWGIAGDFLDFWDAFLWLFAFVFIELNIFEWQEETRESGAAGH